MSFITQKQTIRKMWDDTVFYFKHLPPGGTIRRVRSYFVFMRICWGRKVEYNV